MPDASVDSVVTDPPYLIGFMGKGWDAADGIAGQPEVWAECLRVLKPGGHLLAFGATRTYHRMTVAIEDAGFEIRDSLHWCYGSGFPKSLDVSKAIDKAAGAEREVVGRRTEGRYAYDFDGTANRPTGAATGSDDAKRIGGFVSDKAVITAPATDAARQWSGWGTALKPAHEPIVVARKPLVGTVAGNVLAYGTGALNIDRCRVGFVSEADEQESKAKNQHADFGTEPGGNNVYGDYSMVERKNYDPPGRWPANLVLTHAADCADECADGCPVAELDGQSGVRAAGAFPQKANVASGEHYEGGGGPVGRDERKTMDTGGASRFFTVTEWDPTADVPPFRYVAKPSKRERNAGLDGLPEVQANPYGAGREGVGKTGHYGPRRNTHPTVKPVALMRWLVRLVTAPGGTVLDPFAGSGTTLVAATLEGFDAIGIEMTDDYLPIIEGRVAWAEQQADKMTPTLFDDAGQGVRVTSLAGASIDPTGDATPGQGQV
jgi:site-specific DNA-methyltransferase (adenine-specific)